MLVIWETKIPLHKPNQKLQQEITKLYKICNTNVYLLWSCIQRLVLMCDMLHIIGSWGKGKGTEEREGRYGRYYSKLEGIKLLNTWAMIYKM